MSIRKSLVISSLSQYLLKVIGFASVIIMARLLTPEELGTYAIAGTVVLIASELKLMGAASFLIREKELSKKLIARGLGLALIFSWTLGFALFVFSTKLAAFFSMSRLDNIFCILSVAFLLTPFSSISTALLSRELRFDKILKISVGTELVRFFATIYLVLNQYSIEGLALGFLIGSICELLLVVIYRPSIMTYIPSFKNLAPIFKFGMYTSFTNLIAKFESNLSDLVIGKLGAASDVAYFSRGVGLFQFITTLISSGIWSVSLPYLSKVSRDGGDLPKAYSKATLMLGGICWPVLASAGVLSDELIMVLFGEQWQTSVVLAKILSIWAVIRVIHTFFPQLLITAKKEKYMLYKQLLLAVAVLALIYFSFPFGLEAVAWAMVVSSLVDLLIISIILYFVLGINPFGFLYSLKSNFFITFTCVLSAYIVKSFLITTDNQYIALISIAPILMITWLSTICVLKHPLYNEIKSVFFNLKKKLLV